MLAYLIDWLVIMGAHLLVWPVVLTYVALNIADYLSFLPIASAREFLAQHIKQSHRPILHIGHSLLSGLPILVLRDLPSSLCLIWKAVKPTIQQVYPTKILTKGGCYEIQIQ